MYTDFEYDGERLSDYGCMVCTFDTSGVETEENGAALTFNTVPALMGNEFHIVSASYEDCLEMTFQICKIPELWDNYYFSISDIRRITNWLCRKEYHKVVLLSDEYDDLYFEGSFNVDRLEFGGRVCGLELTLTTNRPYARSEPVTLTLDNSRGTGNFTILNKSDDEGIIYPKMKIRVLQRGDLSITNSFENRTMFIANCSDGEIITLDYPVISTSLNSHQICNDFNYNFFRLARRYRENANHITVSIPCTITMTYSPAVKIGLSKG